VDLLCRKLGMTQIFDDQGRNVPVTVLEAGPNFVIQKKTVEKDGYAALQLGFIDRRRKTLSKPEAVRYEKAGVATKRYLQESRIAPEDAASYEVGQELKADLFQAGQRVDVVGTSKGRGTAGVIKRHNFGHFKMSHGTHEFFRHGGSIGPGTFPGHVIKGLRMAGRYGNERVTTRNLLVARVDAARNLLFVRGAVPGHPNALVRVRPAIKSSHG
jgi:large subunit ribosomal protein L3